MILPKFVSSLVQMGRTYRAGGYPPFVYSDGDTSGYLPVFFFHDVGEEEFAGQLTYLRENGYSTVDCDAAVSLLTSGRVDDHSVMLTIDDGLVSLYHTVYPMAAEFQTKVVSYIAPEWIGYEGYVTWEQCREMHASGFVDIQSHSYTHARRLTELTVQGVWKKGLSRGPDWEVPELRPRYLANDLRRFPIFPGESLFSTKSLLRLPDQFWLDCLELATGPVGNASARAFQALADRYQGDATRVEANELLEEMTAELIASKTAIEAKLPGHNVQHFAFPWHLNSAASWQALDKAGFQSAAVGLDLPGEDHVPGTVRMLLRVNGDFLLCLPGKQRWGFTRVVGKKVKKSLGLRV